MSNTNETIYTSIFTFVEIISALTTAYPSRIPAGATGDDVQSIAKDPDSVTNQIQVTFIEEETMPRMQRKTLISRFLPLEMLQALAPIANGRVPAGKTINDIASVTRDSRDGNQLVITFKEDNRLL